MCAYILIDHWHEGRQANVSVNRKQWITLGNDGSASMLVSGHNSGRKRSWGQVEPAAEHSTTVKHITSCNKTVQLSSRLI